MDAVRFLRMLRHLNLWICAGIFVILAMLCAFVAHLVRSGKEDTAQTSTTEILEEAYLAIPDDQRDSRIKPTKEWSSEVFAEQAAEQLQTLRSLLERGGLDEPIGICNEAVRFTALVPHKRETMIENSYLKATLGAEHRSDLEIEHSGQTRFAEALREWRESMGESAQLKFKIVKVELSEEGEVNTEVKIEVSNLKAAKILQQGIRWQCDWTWDGNSLPLIERVRLLSFADAEGKDKRWFTDLTPSIFKNEPVFEKQLAYGMQYWLQRVSKVHGMLYFRRCGLAVGDVNGDRLEDVYLCQPGGLPNRLLLSQEDGTVRDAARPFGVDVLDHTSSALFVDLDNDGDQDLAIAGFEGMHIFENRKGQRFALQQHVPFQDDDLHALSAVDFDQDGNLDLYVSVDAASHNERAFVYHDANDGGANRLFRNQGVFNFKDVTLECGLDENNRRHSLATAWEDFDNDGDQDLYVANDYGQNCLYRNDGGRFTDVAADLGVVDFGSGMSVSWADYDRDGNMDLYVGNMFSSAGGRITSQQQFLPVADAPVRSLYRRFVKGNTLFRNRSLEEAGFEDVGDQAGVEFGRWSWSSVFADIDNDGWEDLFVANGYITGSDPGDL